jgi:hypothetical protein
VRAVERIDADLDVETRQVVKKDRDLLTTIASAGKAWEASLDVDKDGMTLQNYWNEACSRWLDRIHNGKWMLRRLRNACD